MAIIASDEMVLTEVEDGEDGQDGAPGLDGKDGKDGKDGADGQDGQDGISPVVSFTDITGGVAMTVVDALGTHTVNIMDGVDGQDGAPGQNGQNGQNGQDGAPGADAPKIVSVQRYYKKALKSAAAPTTPVDNTWSTSKPAYLAGWNSYNVYFTDKTTYDDNSVSYSAVSIDVEWPLACQAHDDALAQLKFLANYSGDTAADIAAFNEISNNGATQGLFKKDSNGNVYINASLIKAGALAANQIAVNDLLAFNATIGGFLINSEDLCIFTDDYTATIVNSNVEFFDEYDEPGSHAKGLYYGISPATPAFATGVPAPTVYPSGGEPYRELGDINAAKAKMMHDGSFYAGKYPTQTAPYYNYTFKADGDEVFLGKNDKVIINDSGVSVDGVYLFAPAKEILTFGNYTTLNTDISLSDPYTDFRFILFRFGGGGGQGTVNAYIPTNAIYDGTNYSVHQASWYIINNNVPELQLADFKFTADSKIQLTYRYGSGSNGLRQVKGIY